MRELLDLEGAIVADHMHAGVLACAAETPLADVARMMSRHGIHCVVVLQDAGSGWGIVSDLDLVEMAASGEAAERTAGDCSVTPTVLVHPGDTLAHAAQLMASNATAHLLVTKTRAVRPLGVLSTLDIARALVGD